MQCLPKVVFLVVELFPGGIQKTGCSGEKKQIPIRTSGYHPQKQTAGSLRSLQIQGYLQSTLPGALALVG